MAVKDPVRRKLTYEDYMAFPDDGNRHEILDGEHFVTAAPHLWHQSVVAELIAYMTPLENASRFPQPAGHDGELVGLVPFNSRKSYTSRHQPKLGVGSLSGRCPGSLSGRCHHRAAGAPK